MAPRRGVQPGILRIALGDEGLGLGVEGEAVVALGRGLVEPAPEPERSQRGAQRLWQDVARQGADHRLGVAEPALGLPALVGRGRQEARRSVAVMQPGLEPGQVLDREQPVDDLSPVEHHVVALPGEVDVAQIGKDLAMGEPVAHPDRGGAQHVVGDAERADAVEFAQVLAQRRDEAAARVAQHREGGAPREQGEAAREVPGEDRQGNMRLMDLAQTIMRVTEGRDPRAHLGFRKAVVAGEGRPWEIRDRVEAAIDRQAGAFRDVDEEQVLVG